MSKVSEEDKLLFEHAIQGVKPLKTHNLHDIDPIKPKPLTKYQLQKKHRYQSLAIPVYDFTEAVSAFESLIYYKKGLRMQDLAKLRKGEFSVEGRLDLHGYTEELAQQKLTQFIQQSAASQKRYLLVVHGKGYNSDTQTPVLKNLANRLLRALPGVLAFCSATQKDGGVGAVYVLLKSVKTRSEEGF